MKKIRKSNIFSFVLGAIIFSSIIGVSAFTILADNISYKDNMTVSDALDELYNKTSLELVYSFYPTTYNDGTLTETVNLDKGKYFVIITMANSEGFDNILDLNISNATILNEYVDYHKNIGGTTVNTYQCLIDVDSKKDITFTLNQNNARGYTMKLINIYKN